MPDCLQQAYQSQIRHTTSPPDRGAPVSHQEQADVHLRPGQEK